MLNHHKPYQVWSWPAKVENSHIRVDPGIVPFEKSEKAIRERYVSNTNGQYEKCLKKVVAERAPICSPSSRAWQIAYLMAASLS